MKKPMKLTQRSYEWEGKLVLELSGPDGTVIKDIVTQDEADRMKAGADDVASIWRRMERDYEEYLAEQGVKP